MLEISAHWLGTTASCLSDLGLTVRAGSRRKGERDEIYISRVALRWQKGSLLSSKLQSGERFPTSQMHQYERFFLMLVIKLLQLICRLGVWLLSIYTRPSVWIFVIFCLFYLHTNCFRQTLELNVWCHWKKAAGDSFEAHLLCQLHTSSSHLLVLFRFQRWVHNRHARCNIGAVALLPGFCLRGFFLWLGDTVSYFIGKIIRWDNSFWYCPYSSCHSVQMCFQIRRFPSGLFYPRITCDYMWMWLKPRGVALMEREAPEHTVSVSGLWLRGMYLF